MQTTDCCYANKSVVTGIWYTYIIPRSRDTEKGTKMSKTAAIGLVPSSTLFGRLMATIDRLLMQSAQIAIRNGDLPRFGI